MRIVRRASGDAQIEFVCLSHGEQILIYFLGRIETYSNFSRACKKVFSVQKILYLAWEH
jgi:hypothetical protein